MQRIATLTKQLLAGDRATLARAITLVESRSPKWQAVGQELVSTSVAEGKKDTAARGGGFSIFFPIFSFSFLYLFHICSPSFPYNKGNAFLKTPF